MPANLPPEYHKIEATLRDAKTAPEKIEICEKLISVIPKHKGTEKLLALYKSKIAKLRRRDAEASFDGQARVCLFALNDRGRRRSSSSAPQTPENQC